MSKKYEIQDSGKRSEFSTGAVRDIQEGKGRFDLLPWRTIWALARHYEKGCAKYTTEKLINWEDIMLIGNVCSCKRKEHLTVIQKEIIMQKECAEIATKENLENKILILLKDKEKTQEGGLKEIVNLKLNSTTNIEDYPKTKNGLSYLEEPEDMLNLVFRLMMLTNYWKFKMGSVQSVGVSQKNDGWTLTTTMIRENLEDSFALSVIKDLDFLGIVKKELKKHSNTCGIHLLKFLKKDKKFKIIINRNWELGIPTSRYLDSAIRHLTKFSLGYDKENHLIACLWNITCMYETILRIQKGILPKELYDLPNKVEI